MPNFDINSRFNKDANFSQVVFGEDGYVLETELNEMQHIQDEARASLIRESIPSGVLNYFEPTMLPKVPNTFRLEQEMKVNVNGQIITLPENLDIVLNEPPTADFKSVTGKVGYREDLVFLEAWKEEVDYTDTIPKFGGEGQPSISNDIKDGRVGVETTRRIQWKWRIRVVDDVDFNKFKFDGFTNNVGSNDTRNILPQGGNEEAPTLENCGWDENTLYHCSYVKASNCESTARLTLLKSSGLYYDSGLIVGGTGRNYSGAIKTLDGYCYAIPLFRVKRRNSGGYSVENGNGAMDRKFTKYTGGGEVISSLSNSYWNFKLNDTSMFKVGDIITRTDLLSQSSRTDSPFYMDYSAIITDISDNVVKSVNLFNKSSWNIASTEISILNRPYRPDKLFSDVIDERDIIDLRHKVSLTGFNYQELLDENFDRLLTGELKTKEGKKMLKTYHGIGKTPVDVNTIFYLSGDSATAEIGETVVIDPLVRRVATPAGFGFISDANNKLNHYEFPFNNLMTIDCLTKSGCPFVIRNNDNKNLMFMEISSKAFHFRNYKEDGNWTSINIPDFVSGAPLDSWIHFRVVIDYENRRFRGYFNGKKVLDSYVHNGVFGDCSKLKLFVGGITSAQIGYPPSLGCIMSDLMISNIDRGDNFATLPKDFKDGYATIAPAFNEQRQIFGDPFISQFTTELIKCTGETKRQFIITQATSGKWASGDKIKLSGLGDEAITGVIDYDTALATVIINVDGSYTDKVYVSDTSKLLVGDTISIFGGFKNVIWTNKKITEVNEDESYIKVEGLNSWDNSYNGCIIVESTSSSSSPVLKYMNGSTITNVVGTWTGLGTKECTFTFGENANLTNQDLEIQYSLNAQAGQCGISEVLTATLGGEYNGQKLTRKGSLTITDDFVSKTAGITNMCPHTARHQHQNSALPTYDLFSSFGAEFIDGAYKNISTIGGDKHETTTPINEKFPIQLYTFDLIRIVEDKFGEIPSIDKAKWLKENISYIIIDHTGYGVIPDGNKLRLSIFRVRDKEWGHAINSHFNPTNTTIGIDLRVDHSNNILKQVQDFISDSGKVYFSVYTDGSDGVTPSSIFTDYITISVGLKVETGFDVVALENTRRDAGKSGALLVRKETKEVRRYPLGIFKVDSQIVTYGDYVPYQLIKEHRNNNDSSFIGNLLLEPNYAIISSVIGSKINISSKENFMVSFEKYRNLINNTFPSDIISKCAHTEEILSNDLQDVYCPHGWLKKSDLTLSGNYGSIYNWNRIVPLLDREVPLYSFGISPMLSVIDGEIYIMLICSPVYNHYFSYNHSDARALSAYMFMGRIKLKGSPLIKEVY